VTPLVSARPATTTEKGHTPARSGYLAAHECSTRGDANVECRAFIGTREQPDPDEPPTDPECLRHDGSRHAVGHAVRCVQLLAFAASDRLHGVDLASFMVTIDRNNAVESRKAMTSAAQAEPELPVHCEVEVLVDERRGESASANERGRLDDEVGIAKEPVTEPRRPDEVQELVICAHQRPVSVDNIDGWISYEELHGLLDPGRIEVRVVGVQPSDDLAAAQREGLVDRVRLPAVGLADPSHGLWSPVENVQRLIGRAAVANHVLDRCVALIEDR
jgi:hypothetical protein